jgi:peptidoglycan/xylan/chitin deacetylase (PgdA/CDA1 family)
MIAKTKVILVFDDGFAKSSIATAKVFEEFGLRALFAVLAEPTDFATNFVKGDFALWNELLARGHHVHPHGYTHARMPDLTYEQGVAELQRCIATFSEKLNGFDPKRCIYHFTYNLSTPPLIQWLLPRFGAVRIQGTGFLRKEEIDSRVWGSKAHGPEDPYDVLNGLLDQCAGKNAYAFMFCLHGIDGEAWGAIALDNLRRILERITSDPQFEYWLP